MNREPTPPAGGDELSDLYDRFCPRVYNYVRYRCDDDAVAEDLAAQVFERLARSLPEVQARGAPLEGWVFTVARNLVNDHYRRGRLFATLPWEAFLRRPAADPPPEDQVLKRERHAQLTRALRTLSERERDLLGLKFSSGLNNRQIAVLTHLSESNVAVILHRALGRLRAALQGSDWLNEELPCQEPEVKHDRR